MKSNATTYKGAALAIALAVFSVPAYADEYGTSARSDSSSGSKFVIDKQPPVSRPTDLSDVTTNARCGPLADEEPFWQPPERTSPTLAEPAPMFQLGPPNPVF